MSAAAQAFIITLREGMEAALVVAIVLAYLGRTGQEHLRGSVYAGLGLAVAASIAGAVVLQRISLNQEAFEGFILMAAAVMVASLLVWMHRHARSLPERIERRLEAVSAAAPRPSGSFGVWLGVFLFTFLTVFREGVEIVLLLRVSGLSTEELLNFTGGCVGLGLSLLFGVLFVRGTLRVDLPRFFRVTTIVLAFFVAQLLINGIHELTEAEILPTTRQIMALVGPVVRNSGLFVAGLLLLPLWLLLVRGGVPPAKEGERENPAEARKRRAAALRAQRARMCAAALAVAVVAALGLEAFVFRRPRSLSPAVPVTIDHGWVRIPLGELEQGKLYRYSATVANKPLRFLVLKTNGRVACAMDACRLCGDRGYAQQGEQIICVNCDAEINPATFGQEGGCNPIPLAFQVKDGAVAVASTELARHEHYFAASASSEQAETRHTCLLCGMEVAESRAVKVARQGRTYYFCPMGCAQAFEMAPEKYLRAARQANPGFKPQ
ncbi:MAG: DUF2318 domain-containing protein [Armatimonadetes bacterium]|nr:DUF2318 domain-containing protein [Armatimonadota bacterium]